MFVEKTPEGKALQRALLQYYEPRNAEKVIKALRITHREDLIPLLVPAAGRRAVQRGAKRAEARDVTIHPDGTYTVHSKGAGRSEKAAGRKPVPGARFAPRTAPKKTAKKEGGGPGSRKGKK